MEELGSLLLSRKILDADQVTHYESLLERFSNSVGYAEEADRKLR